MVNLRSCVSSRNSSLELVRLLAMFMIVVYHLILFFIEPIDPSPIYKAVQIPVHIGVILFVLISGYFGIKPTFRGFFKILCVVAVYYLPLRLWYVNQMGMGNGQVKLFSKPINVPLRQSARPSVRTKLR